MFYLRNQVSSSGSTADGERLNFFLVIKHFGHVGQVGLLHTTNKFSSHKIWLFTRCNHLCCMTKKVFFLQKFNVGIKNEEFDIDFKSVEKVAKKLI